MMEEGGDMEPQNLSVKSTLISESGRPLRGVYHHGQLGLSLAFPPFDVRGQNLVSTKGRACKLY
jgi:hypothetical protein